MSPHKKTKGVIILLLLMFFIVLFQGCDKAKDGLEDTADRAIEKTDKIIDEAAEKADKVADEISDKIKKKSDDLLGSNFLLGTWSGVLDSRKTTLIVSSQDGNSISGKMTINYRTPINQEIKGTFNSSTKKLLMEDQLHSRYKGRYDGEISEDGKTYSGTFTTLVDKNSYKFNLTKIN